MSDALTSLGDNAIGPLGLDLFAGTGPRRTQSATTPAGLYGMALRAPTPPYLPLFFYVFPLGPGEIERRVMGMGNYYDVQGPVQKFGVNRIVDLYGQSPPVYRIFGTTGVKYHSADHYLFTGLQSIIILSDLISQYFALNAQQAQNGNPNLYLLEFYDYYMAQFWRVVPLGPQRLLQRERQAQLVYYDLRLVATESLYEPLGSVVDSLLDTIAGGVEGIFSQTQSTLDDSFTPNYAQYTIVSQG